MVRHHSSTTTLGLRSRGVQTSKGLVKTPVRRYVPTAMQTGHSTGHPHITRRNQGILMVGSVVLTLSTIVEPSHAFGKSAKELAKEAKERRAKLKQTAEKMKSAGKASDAFESSNYSVPEEATTPNVVNRNRNVD